MARHAIAVPPEDKLLPLLSGVVEDGNGRWKAFCPIHEADGQSHDPSLHIEKGQDGRLLLHCFPCGPGVKAPQFCYAVGLTQADLYPEDGPGGKRKIGGKSIRGSKKEGSYVYRDAQGAIVCKVEKIRMADGSKECPSYRPNGEGGWVAGIKGVKRVPYRLPELIAAPIDQVIFVVEGEGKADALAAWGLTATCNIGGAGKWNKDYAQWFAGRTVVILPDNDPVNPETGRIPGLDHANDVLKSLRPVAASVRFLILPDLPLKGDVVDWIAAGGTLPQLMRLISELAADKTESLVEEKAQEAAAAVAEMDPLDMRIPESLTDVGNGRRLIKKHGAEMKFCHPWGKWLVWTGKHWRIDDTGEASRRAKSVVDDLWEEYRTISNDVSEDYAKKLIAFAKYSGGANSLVKMLACASTEPDSQVVPSQLDSDGWLLNVDNGTVDLRTGEIRPHDQADLLTKLSPTKFNPEATCPSWEKFLLEIFVDQSLVSYTQRLTGYWSTGVIREQMLPVLHGGGSNGKTTFLEAIMNTLGSDYAMKAPADFLMVKRNDAHPTDKADLFGKRVVVCAETDDGKRLAESMVKELTGDEKIRARRMREDFWEFDPTHKILLVTNHKPIIRGTDHGIWRRIRLIPFLKQFWNPDAGETGPPELRQDGTLKDRIREEHSGILTWIVRGCLEWLHDGEQQPDAVKEQTGAYRASQDVLGAFIDQCCQIGVPTATYVEVGILYTAYRKWCDQNGEYAVTQRQFGLSMTERRFDRVKSNGWWYMGIKLNDELPA